MKKLALVASIATIGFASTAFVAPKSTTENSFEGIVTYSITTDNEQANASMQNSSVKVYIKGDKSKSIMDMGMYKVITITDEKKPDDPIILSEVMGNKYQIKTDKTKKDKNQDPTIKYMDDTKQVAGYACHKAEVTMSDKTGQSVVATVYYTQDLPAYPGGSGEFKGLKGFPLEYTMQQQGINITMTATKVDKQSVTEDTFTVPSGYKLMTTEEMQADLQKNMGAAGN